MQLSETAGQPGRFRDATRAIFPAGENGNLLDLDGFGTYGISSKRRAADGPVVGKSVRGRRGNRISSSQIGDREQGDEINGPHERDYR